MAVNNGRNPEPAERPRPASPQMRDVVDSVHNAANSVHQAADSVANTIESFAYRIDSVVNGVNSFHSPGSQRRAERYQRKAERYQRRAARYGGWSGSGGDDSKPPPSTEERARKRAKELREFYGHLITYLCVIGFLAIISLADGEFWFLWPAGGWGIAIVFHALSVFGPDHMFDQDWEDRKAQELAEAEQRRAATPSSAAARPAAKPGEVAEIVRQGINQVAGLRQLSLQIPKPAVRMQALSICSSADNILTVLAEQPDEVRTARDFVDRYLGPTQTILSQYVRLTGRGVTSAEPALAKVENQDLPLLSSRMHELYERLHRGDLIDLQVASEMLEMELPGGPEDTLAPAQQNQNAGITRH